MEIYEISVTRALSSPRAGHNAAQLHLYGAAPRSAWPGRLRARSQPLALLHIGGEGKDASALSVGPRLAGRGSLRPPQPTERAAVRWPQGPRAAERAPREPHTHHSWWPPGSHLQTSLLQTRSLSPNPGRAQQTHRPGKPPHCPGK